MKIRQNSVESAVAAASVMDARDQASPPDLVSSCRLDETGFRPAHDAAGGDRADVYSHAPVASGGQPVARLSSGERCDRLDNLDHAAVSTIDQALHTSHCELNVGNCCARANAPVIFSLAVARVDTPPARTSNFHCTPVSRPARCAFDSNRTPCAAVRADSAHDLLTTIEEAADTGAPDNYHRMRTCRDRATAGLSAAASLAVLVHVLPGVPS